MRKKRSRRASGDAARTGRGLVTILLLLLVGFFGFSIYLGYVSDPRPAGEQRKPAQATRLDLPEPSVPQVGSPTLVVLNGCGRAGLGAQAGRWLRRQGFDVFEAKNADRKDYPQTLVVCRSHRDAAARTVADRLQRTLGIGLLIQQKVKVPEADVLLILGKDFPDSLPVF